jgi:hypothetical protein
LTHDKIGAFADPSAQIHSLAVAQTVAAGLATRANVKKNTVYLFEAGQRTLTANNLAAPRRAIEAEGIRLLFDRHVAGAGIASQTAEIDLDRSQKH